MLFSLIASIVISGAASITVGGIEVTENNQIWTSVISNPSTDSATLQVYKSEAFGECSESSILTIAPDNSSVIGGALKYDGKDNLLLFYTLTKGVYDGKGEIFMRRCDLNQPNTWSDPVKVGVGCVHSAPVIMDNGRIVLPVSVWGPDCIDSPEVSVTSDIKPGALTYVSDDNGLSWIASEVVNVPERRFAAYNNPSLVQTRAADHS